MPDKKLNIEKYLLKGLKKSDHDSFRQLFEKYSHPLYIFSLSYLKSEEIAEDIVQETFIKIWDKRTEIELEKSFQSYLFTIALNCIRKNFNIMAGRNQLKHDLLILFSVDKETFDENKEYQQLLDKLEELINQLPEKRRGIFIKKKLEGVSLKDIADEFDITTKTVEYHITEAMKFLKKEFEKMQIGGMIFFNLFVKNNIKTVLK